MPSRLYFYQASVETTELAGYGGWKASDRPGARAIKAWRTTVTSYTTWASLSTETSPVPIADATDPAHRGQSGASRRAHRLLGNLYLQREHARGRRRHLRPQADARPGSRVVLWGEGLPVEEVASHSGTIPYELDCRIATRVEIVEGNG